MEEQRIGGRYRLLLSRRKLLTAGLAFAAAFKILPPQGRVFAAVADDKVPGWTAALQVFAASLMDTILPEDEGTGALIVGGPLFLNEVMRGEASRPDFRAALVEGLDDLHATMRAQIGAPFETQPALRRHNELARFDSVTYLSLAAGNGSRAQRAYVMLKEITLIAFFTNEAVAKSLLDYSPVPGQYQADLPLTADIRAFYEDEMAGGYFKYAGHMP